MNPPTTPRSRRLLRLSTLTAILGIVVFYTTVYYRTGAFAFPLSLMFEPDLDDAGGVTFKQIVLLEGDPVTAMTFTSGPRSIDYLLPGIQKYPTVEKIIFFSAPVGDQGMVHLQGLRKLRDLTINSVGLTDQGLENIKSLTCVQKLNLTNTKITDAGLEFIKHWPELRTLCLRETGVTDRGMETVGGMAALEELYLPRTGVTDAGLKHLSRLTKLRLLWPTRAIGDQGLEHLRNLPALAEIELSDTQVTDAGLAHLASCPLRKIGLARTKVTAAGLKHLPRGSLAELDLSDTPIGDDALAIMAECLKLHTLKLSRNMTAPDPQRTRITDTGLAKLQTLKNLESLDLYGCSAITDQGVMTIAKLPKLSRLTLTGTKVSDAALAELARMPQLIDLWLFNTAITEQGLVELRKALPNLIIHQNVSFNVNHFDRIATRGDLVILSPWGPLPELADNPDTMISRTAVEFMQRITDAGGVCNARAADDGRKLHFEKPVRDLATLAEVIDFYSEKGKRPFEAITVWGHTGVKFGMISPGVCLQKATGRTDNPPGFRFDFNHLESADGKNAIASIRRALIPEGYVRIAGCGYKFTAGEEAGVWERQVDSLAKQIGMPVIFPESKPACGMNTFSMLTMNTGRKCCWITATPR